MSDVMESTAVFCECGCGEQTNGRWLTFLALHADGLTVDQAAFEVGFHTDYGKKILAQSRRGTFGPRFVAGHHAQPQSTADRVQWSCERCGGMGWATPVEGRPLPRYCGRRACLATTSTFSGHLWRLLSESVDARRRNRHARRVHVLAEAKRRRGERQERQRQAAFDTERKRQRRELRLSRQRRRAPEFVRRLSEMQRAELLAQYRMQREWIEAQSEEVRSFLNEKERTNFTDLSLDKVYGDSWTLAGAISSDGPGNVRWQDPVADLAALADEHQRALLNLLALVKHAPIVPVNFVDGLADGSLRLDVDNGEVRFLVQKDRRRDAVPWQDAPGPIPSVSLNSPGGMAHHHSSRKQKQKVGRTGRRPSGKSKVSR